MTEHEAERPIWADAKRPILDADWTQDGNAFWLLGKASKAQRRAGWTADQRDAWHAEATSGDYDHLLQTVLAWHGQPEDEDFDDDDGDEY